MGDIDLPSIRSFLLDLHHSHHIGFTHLSQIAKELFGLSVSEEAIVNVFYHALGSLEKARVAGSKPGFSTVRAIVSDETTH